MATSSCAAQSLPLFSGVPGVGVGSVWSHSALWARRSASVVVRSRVSISLVFLWEKAAWEVGLACHGSVCYKRAALPRARLRS